MKKLVVVLAGIIVSVQVLACSCMPVQKLTQNEYDAASDIFVGKALEVDTLVKENLLRVKFKVKQNIKGADYKEVIVTTPLSSAACGLNIKEGEKWYIFGSKDGERIRVNMCGRHMNVSKPACKLFAKDKKAVEYDKERYKQNKNRLESELDLIDTMKKG